MKRFTVVLLICASALSAAFQAAFGQLLTEKTTPFTRADTLRGMLTPRRTCYDVTYYHLDVSIDTSNRAISGNVLIRFKVVDEFDRMQIDLFENMGIDKILYKNKPLAYTREFNAALS